METYWSDNIQTSRELYASRAIRFRADNQAVWLPPLGVLGGMDVLEVGCGSGLLAHRVRECVPGARVVGLDRDRGHIAFAREKAGALGLDMRFDVGDALALPYADGSFDVVYSHTVYEHVPAAAFLGEQLRVLRPGGHAVVLIVLPKYGMRPESWLAPDGEERALMDRLWAGVDMADDAAHGVGQYLKRPQEVPLALEAAGFARVNVDVFVLLGYAPDNAAVGEALALDMLNEGREGALASMEKAMRRNPGALDAGEGM